MGSFSAGRDAGRPPRRKPLRETVQVAYSWKRIPLGWVGIIGHSKGLVRVILETKSLACLIRTLRKHYPTITQKKWPLFRKTELFFDHYFKGEAPSSPPLDLTTLSPFQRKVLREVCQVPLGHVRTYSWLAKRVRSSKGTRACGQALHRNPLPLLIPCHRIIFKSGKTGEFVWGKKMKKRLLRLEKEKG